MTDILDHTATMVALHLAIHPHATIRELRAHSGLNAFKVRRALDDLEQADLITYWPTSDGRRTARTLTLKGVFGYPDDGDAA